MEKYQGKRASLFSNVLIRRLASSGLDMVPLAGDISMALKGITGKDYITNEKLSGKQRLIYTSVGVIGTALFFVPGMNVASEGVRDLIVQGKAVNKGLLNGKSTAALKSLAQAGLTKGETYSSAATVLLKTAEFMEKHPSLVRAAESKVEDVLLANHPRNVKYRSQKLATV